MPRAFGEISSYEFFNSLIEGMQKEINSLSKEYVLNVDEKEYNDYLIQRHSLEPLNVNFDSETFEEPTKGKELLQDPFRGDHYEAEVYNFHIQYSFTGAASIFRLHPSTFVITGEEIFVNSSMGTVGFSFKMTQLNAEKFRQEKDQRRSRAFANLNHANNDVHKWNQELPTKAKALFSNIKNKYINENSFFKEIKLKTSTATSNVFSAPTLIKKTVTQPKISDKHEFTSEPAMAMSIYKEIISIIYSSGKNMEQKPALYIGKDEEGLRDQFLFVLESKYDGTTVTGETFNRNGKTDIILKYQDGTNLFIAECKIWHGSNEFHNAISQLFDRYLTWRDSKVALLLFVKNNKFSSVIDTIRSEAKNHPYFLKENGNSGESSFSYIFSLPQDKDRHVYLEIMAFHYDKK